MSTNESKRRRLPRASTVLACVALFAALGGSAVAAKKVIDGKNIKKNSVTTKAIKDGGIKTKDLSKGTVADLQDVEAIELANESSNNIPANSNLELIGETVPPGTYAITAKTILFNNGDDTQSCRVEVGNETVDEARVNPETGATARTLTIPMTGIATVDQGEELRLECSTASDIGSADDSRIVAVKVG